MNSVTGWLAATAATVTAVTILAGAVWWLVWPRLEDKIEEVAKGVRRVEQQTASDDPDTLSRHARVAARAASEIPEIREQLDRMAETQTRHDEWQTNTDRRLTKLEAVLLELLSSELRQRLRDED